MKVERMDLQPRPPAEIVITLTESEARILRCITFLTTSLPGVVSQEMSPHVSHNQVRDFLLELNERLIDAYVNYLPPQRTK